MSTIESALVVDDEPELREILGFELRGLGLEIHEAANGKEALVSLAKHKVSMVFSDVIMPEMNGLELLRSLRSLHVVTPFIIISAAGERSVALEALRLGAFDFIDKPFDLDKLADVVKSALEISRRGAPPFGQVASLAEARQHVARIKTLRYSVAVDTHDERRRLIDELLTEAGNHLQFARDSLANIAAAGDVAISHLFRLTQALRNSAQSLGLAELTTPLAILEESYGSFRVSRSAMSSESVAACKLVHDALLAYIQSNSAATIDGATSLELGDDAAAALEFLAARTAAFGKTPCA